MRRSLRPRYWRPPTANRARCSICAGAIPEMARSPCRIRRLAPLGACRPSREGLDRAAVRCIRSRTVPVAALDRGAGNPASPRLGAWFAMTPNSAGSPASSAFGSQSRRHVGREPALDRQAARVWLAQHNEGIRTHLPMCTSSRPPKKSRPSSPRRWISTLHHRLYGPALAASAAARFETNSDTTRNVTCKLVVFSAIKISMFCKIFLKTRIILAP